MTQSNSPMFDTQHAQDEYFMQQAYQLAQQASEQGEIPVGAVIVSQGEIIGQGYNCPISSHDPTAHAEIIALRAACQRLQNYRLPQDAVLYVTLEPCTMCVGALIHARIQRVVFATHEPKAGSLISARRLLESGYYNHSFQYDYGCLQAQCSYQLSQFFRQRRKQKRQKKSNTMTMIITIDGPSGSGKGTLAVKLAQHYHYHLLDSGAIYRLLGLALHQKGLLDDLEQNLKQAEEIAHHLDIEFKTTDTGVQAYLNGENVNQLIRTEEVGAYASKVAAAPSLRQALLQRQQNFAQGQGLVADGRDMGTVVFPNAPVKIYLTASAQSRAQRRVKQLQLAGQNANIEQILAQIEERDKRDMERSTAPLKPADDALIIDSSNLSIDEVFQQMTDYIQSRS